MTIVVETKKNYRRCTVVQLLALWLLLVASKGVWAESCTGGGGSYTVTMPASVVVPRDVPVGTQLTGWFSSPSSTSWYSCSGAANVRTGNAAAPAAGLTATGTTWSSGGQTYQLYGTGVTGVGVAISFNDYNYSYSWSGWTAVNPSGGMTVGLVTPPVGWTGGGVASSSSYSGYAHGGQMQFTLVKTGPVTGGTTQSGLYAQVAAWGVSAGIMSANRYYFSLTSTLVTVAACTTPNILVPLGAHSPSEMASVGSTTNAVAFNINLNSCPAGMNSIQYRIDPVTTVVNSAQSVVALNGGSTAAGVAVQLLNSAGTAAFPLSSYQIFSGYSKTTGGSYTIPLKARYYRTGTITPGTANTSMTFTMSYQ